MSRSEKMLLVYEFYTQQAMKLFREEPGQGLPQFEWPD